MSFEPTPDVLANLEARRLLVDLERRGVTLNVRHGNLSTKRPKLLTEMDLEALRRNKRDLLVLVLMTDDRVLDRLLDLRTVGGVTVPLRSEAACYLCGEPLPSPRRTGRCGWCALAARLFAGGAVPPEIVALFPESTCGPSVHPVKALPFDLAVPA